MERYTPTSTSLFVTSILGIFISAAYVIQFSETWAVTFVIFFAILFVASLVTMANAEPSRQLPKFAKSSSKKKIARRQK